MVQTFVSQEYEQFCDLNMMCLLLLYLVGKNKTMKLYTKRKYIVSVIKMINKNVHLLLHLLLLYFHRFLIEVYAET